MECRLKNIGVQGQNVLIASDLSEADKPTHIKRHGSRRVTAADSREVAADELTGRRQTVGR